MSKQKKVVAASVRAGIFLTGIAVAGAAQPSDKGNGPASVDKGVDRGNPNGANGTIKIDGIDFDGHPDNEPHLDECSFQVDFYGFDVDDTATLTFFRWPGTGDTEEILSLIEIAGAADGGVAGEIDEGAIPVGGDGAGGGVDIDQQVLVTLADDLGEEHPRNGYHVRAEAEIASGDRTYTKTKTFWVGDNCESTTSGEDPGSFGF